MKIVHIAKFYHPHRGGIESVTRTLASGAAQAGHDVEVLCFGPLDDPAEVDGVPVNRCRVIGTVASQPLGVDYLQQAMQACRTADLVHIHTPNLLAALALSMAIRRARSVVHWHSDVVGKSILGDAVRPVELAMLRRADAIIATSPPYFEASKLLAPFKAKTRVIPIGIEDPRSVAADAHLPNEMKVFIGDRSLILSVGRMTAYKGFQHLIDAAGEFDPAVCVVVVGGGELLEDLRAQVSRKGLGDRVLLPGPVDEATLSALYQQASLFCLPSTMRSEAFGVVLLEALAYGLPIVTCNIEGSGVPWVNAHGSTGLNVQPNNAPSLAEACMTILGSPELRHTFGRNARLRYERFFTDAVFVRAVLDLYDQLL